MEILMQQSFVIRSVLDHENILGNLTISLRRDADRI